MRDIVSELELLEALHGAERALFAAIERPDALTSLSDDGLLEAAELAGSVQRLTDTLMVDTVHAVDEQSHRAGPAESLAARHGMRDAMTLLMVLSGASRHTLGKYRRIAAETTPRGIGSTGTLPPLMPHLASAVRAGAIGLDQALVVRGALNEGRGRALPEAAESAERALVAAAIGAPDPFTEEADETDDDPERRSDVATSGAARLPLTADLLAVQARARREAIDPDGPEPSYELQRSRRSFTLGQRPDGMWVGKLLLPTEQGAALRLALDAHNAPRTRARHDDAVPDGLADETAIPLARRGSLDQRSSAQRQADTLVGLVTRAVELGDSPRIGGEPATVVVTITAEQLREHAASGGGTAHLEHTGDAVPAHVAARIICDGQIQTCLLDEAGLPLQLGRARRLHTRHQRRAILIGYPGGCQNPACDAPPGFTEIHHPIWWSDGGRTDITNGIPLCQHCHIEVHAGRLTCVREPSGRWHVRPCLPLRARLKIGIAA